MEQLMRLLFQSIHVRLGGLVLMPVALVRGMGSGQLILEPLRKKLPVVAPQYYYLDRLKEYNKNSSIKNVVFWFPILSMLNRI